MNFHLRHMKRVTDTWTKRRRSLAAHWDEIWGGIETNMTAA